MYLSIASWELGVFVEQPAKDTDKKTIVIIKTNFFIVLVMYYGNIKICYVI